MVLKVDSSWLGGGCQAAFGNTSTYIHIVSFPHANSVYNLSTIDPGGTKRLTAARDK